MNAAKDLDVSKGISRLLELSHDTHNVFTPLPLCRKVASNVTAANGNILVIANVEFVYTLLGAGVDSTNIYFATPCDLKAHQASKLISSDHICRYDTIIKKEDLKGMNFASVIGNPPYAGTLYHQFLTMMIQMAPTGSVIVPAAFMTGNSTADIALRESLLEYGITACEIFPMGTFPAASVQKITTAISWDHSKTGELFDIKRAGNTYTVTELTTGHWNVPFGQIGHNILRKAAKFIQGEQLPMAQGRGKQPIRGHYVAFGEKVAFNQVGWNERYDRLIAGNVQALSDADTPTNAMKRFINVESQEHGQYMADYMTSKLFNVLGGMVGVEKNATKYLFQRIPMLSAAATFSMEHAYNLLDLTAEEREFIEEL